MLLCFKILRDFVPSIARPRQCGADPDKQFLQASPCVTTRIIRSDIFSHRPKLFLTLPLLRARGVLREWGKSLSV